MSVGLDDEKPDVPKVERKVADVLAEATRAAFDEKHEVEIARELKAAYDERLFEAVADADGVIWIPWRDMDAESLRDQALAYVKHLRFTERRAQ